ncbi:MAG: hypothetical protein AAGC57_05320 [Pseudomonadota bacterium]
MVRVRPMFLGAICAAALTNLAIPGLADSTVDGMTCHDRDVIVDVLKREFGETQMRADLHDGPGLIEFFANARSGSWTVLLTPDEHSSCVLESGYLPQPGRPT